MILVHMPSLFESQDVVNLIVDYVGFHSSIYYLRSANLGLHHLVSPPIMLMISSDAFA